ncbi:MAG: AAA family ATPase [Actinobacteria bacterium]|nr:AAA family ATPase [Actinomycetota bacterium]
MAHEGFIEPFSDLFLPEDLGEPESSAPVPEAPQAQLLPGPAEAPAQVPKPDSSEQGSLASDPGLEPQEQMPASEIEMKPLPQGMIIAVMNQKGGVGKTTTTINLGAALAEQGAKVLLVDFDPQGALSVGLGLNSNELDLTVYDLLMDRTVALENTKANSKLEGLDVLPANIDLSAAEVLLVSEVAREQALLRALAPAKATYNYILIDCPPSLGLLTINALTAAAGVLIPLECEFFALKGMTLLMETIAKVQERLNPTLVVQGILPTMLDTRTVHGREVLSRVADAFGDKLFKTVIHKTIRFAESPVAGEPILTYAPSSVGAQEYRDLAREVMSR